MDPNHHRELSVRSDPGRSNDVDAEAILAHPIYPILLWFITRTRIIVICRRPYVFPCLVQRLWYSKPVLATGILLGVSFDLRSNNESNPYLEHKVFQETDLG